MVEILLVDVGLSLLVVGLLGGTASLAAAGLALALLAAFLPVRPVRLPAAPMAGLDAVIPSYQFGEHHETRVAASPRAVYDAVLSVTAREIGLFRLLTWIRSPRLGRPAESILNPNPDQPIVDVATRTGFVLLSDDPGREVVLGTIVCCDQKTPARTPAEFQAREGSLARAVMNFHLSGDTNGPTRLVTQTRIHATDARAARRFGAYWRLIYPGSALIRRTWLRAIKQRAEAGAGRGAV